MEGKVGIEGMPWEELPILAEMAHGSLTVWYKNGQKQEEKNYKDGKRDGLSIHYNKDGTESFRFTYKDGERVKD